MLLIFNCILYNKEVCGLHCPRMMLVELYYINAEVSVSVLIRHIEWFGIVNTPFIFSLLGLYSLNFLCKSLDKILPIWVLERQIITVSRNPYYLGCVMYWHKKAFCQPSNKAEEVHINVFVFQQWEVCHMYVIFGGVGVHCLSVTVSYMCFSVSYQSFSLAEILKHAYIETSK